MTVQHLTSDELDRLRDAVVQADLADPQSRALLFQGVLPMYVGTLPASPKPLHQVQSDLMRMNAVDRLVDGTVPLQIWLQNAGRLTVDSEPAQAFQAALDKVASETAGEPELPPVAELDEVAEEIIHHDDTVSYEFLRLGWEAGAAVARLRVWPFADGHARTLNGIPVNPTLGTAWLVTDELLMTNHHVVAARTRAHLDEVAEEDLRMQGRHATAEFDYDNVNVEPTVASCRELLAWEKTLDYAVLRLAEPSRRRPLTLVTERLTLGHEDRIPVNIIQHPMGEAKRVGIRNNLVTASEERDLRYFTDTRKGSSGSPVLDDRWRVVALHRASRRVVGVKFQGLETAFVNVGTQIAAIVTDLAERFPDVAAEIASVRDSSAGPAAIGEPE